MSRQNERDDRLARSKEVAATAIKEERAARTAKTAKLRALRIAEEKKAGSAVAEPRLRKAKKAKK
jgi:hypothetical protein